MTELTYPLHRNFYAKKDDYTLSVPRSDKERKEVRRFFKANLPIVEEDAVPMTSFDEIYRTVILVARKHSRIVGAVMACTPISLAQDVYMNEESPHKEDFFTVSSLDVIAVDERFRQQGIATWLLSEIEPLLHEQGVETVLGNYKTDVPFESLLAKEGFLVERDTDNFPQFLGEKWLLNEKGDDVYWFYKKI
jgi:ribosomal protein S18 acetylase RimI-like enzyme